MDKAPARGTRTGFTTGACSAAAARACAIGLIEGTVPAQVTSVLLHASRLERAEDAYAPALAYFRQAQALAGARQQQGDQAMRIRFHHGAAEAGVAVLRGVGLK